MVYDVRKRIEELSSASAVEVNAVYCNRTDVDKAMLTVAREVRDACAAKARNYDEAHRNVGELIAKEIEADILLD